MIEICTDDEVQRISLADAGLAPKPSPSHKKAQSEQCLFCAAASDAKSTSQDKHFTMPALASYISNGRGLFIPKSLSAHAFDARGPPKPVV